MMGLAETGRHSQIGLAAVYAYRAYNDSSMLGVAQTVQQVIQNTSQFEADPTTYPGSQAAILKCGEPSFVLTTEQDWDDPDALIQLIQVSEV